MRETVLADQAAARAYGKAQDARALAGSTPGVESLCSAVEELAEAVRRLAGQVDRLTRPAARP